jgi:hypothetical protein
MTASGHRVIVFAADGTLKRVPNWLEDEPSCGLNGVPRYAGTKQRVLSVTLVLEKKRPICALSHSAVVWHTDADGRPIDPEAVGLAMTPDATRALPRWAAKRTGKSW